MLGREIEIVILMGLPWGVFVSVGLIVLRSVGTAWNVVTQRRRFGPPRMGLRVGATHLRPPACGHKDL